MAKIGTLFTVSAPSGAGKTSLLKAVAGQLDHFSISVSTTTRTMRPGEQDGVDYHFATQQDFNNRVAQGEFLEHAEVFGNMYGTSVLDVERALDAGDDIVLEIDWQGAQQIKKRMPSVVSIFILPPSRKTLEERLQGRGQDDAEVIANRMASAINEISHYTEYDYVIINDDFEVAKAELSSIISAERLKLAKQQLKHRQLIDDLL